MFTLVKPFIIDLYELYSPDGNRPAPFYLNNHGQFFRIRIKMTKKKNVYEREKRTFLIGSVFVLIRIRHTWPSVVNFYSSTNRDDTGIILTKKKKILEINNFRMNEWKAHEIHIPNSSEKNNNGFPLYLYYFICKYGIVKDKV